MTGTCATCRYGLLPPCRGRSDDWADDVGCPTGECRRRSPAGGLDENGDGFRMWPAVYAADFCGEYEPRPGNDAAPGSPGR